MEMEDLTQAKLLELVQIFEKSYAEEAVAKFGPNSSQCQSVALALRPYSFEVTSFYVVVQAGDVYQSDSALFSESSHQIISVYVPLREAQALLYLPRESMALKSLVHDKFYEKSVKLAVQAIYSQDALQINANRGAFQTYSPIFLIPDKILLEAAVEGNFRS